MKISGTKTFVAYFDLNIVSNFMLLFRSYSVNNFFSLLFKPLLKLYEYNPLLPDGFFNPLCLLVIVKPQELVEGTHIN